MDQRIAPLLERSQQVSKKLESLENLGFKDKEWIKALAPFDEDKERVRFLLLDSSHNLLSDSYNFRQQGENLPLELVDSVINEKSFQYRRYVNTKGEKLLYTGYPVYNSQEDPVAIIVAMTSLGEPGEALSSLVRRITIIGLIFIVSSLLVYFWFLRDIFSPLDRLEEGVEAMTRGNYSYQIEESEESELSPIVRSFNTLGSRLGDIEAQQKDFVSTLSHELKTPIASMKIITDSLIQAKATVSNEILYDFLEDINSESDRLKDIIDDLLFMASLERQDVSLNLDVRPITRALEESIRVMQPLADQKHITITLEYQEKFFAEFDYNKMKQVFINLIGNAVKYSDEGDEIIIHVWADKDRIHFKFQDNGIGIDAQELPYVFDRFYRVDKARSRERGGTGLGLHIVQQIVNLHNGKIRMESLNDVGTTVYIDFPRVYEV
ncbi:MAG: HAMP domain-containing histidine kinase [Tissierellia bacterium]|nr:HAMP domain-containing histidine kinase [Tissierellia bacterium]